MRSVQRWWNANREREGEGERGRESEREGGGEGRRGGGARGEERVPEMGRAGHSTYAVEKLSENTPMK